MKPKPKAVKSIRDLKREIERQKNAHMGEGVLDLIWVLDLINSFEAGLRRRLKICDDLVEQLKRDGEKWEYHPARVESLVLRRILVGDLLRRAEQDAANLKRLSDRVLRRVRGEE